MMFQDYSDRMSTGAPGCKCIACKSSYVSKSTYDTDSECRECVSWMIPHRTDRTFEKAIQDRRNLKTIQAWLSSKNRTHECELPVPISGIHCHLWQERDHVHLCMGYVILHTMTLEDFTEFVPEPELPAFALLIPIIAFLAFIMYQAYHTDDSHDFVSTHILTTIRLCFDFASTLLRLCFDFVTTLIRICNDCIADSDLL